MTPTLNISPREGCIACFRKDIVPLRLDFAGPLRMLPEDYLRSQRFLRDLNLHSSLCERSLTRQLASLRRDTKKA